ncbi:uracil-DNA glycosylase 2 [Kitasatospora herbaricolor]|uniref:uracil-DNA glycosylase n=1 Tax=Kitasatospora herbaricolor TaxID=68217 RepID=UPI0019CB8491|nr:uracil-DNA glycosylase [Kitasatospora herbaricolor]MDQ0308522.1 uracil-DNA glycosylase [Kitasatospora herbaricolor]GGV13125.1 uracil-DNA glycosylase 2 [Kitasatospora herbaricolor]
MTDTVEAGVGAGLELPESWRGVLADEAGKPYFAELAAFVAAQRAEHQVFPPAGQEFSALDATPYDKVRVLVLGQDPYHDDNQAHGMSFSVLPGVKTPPSLRNIFKELDADLGVPAPDNGYLMSWAEQGVLLLNAVLTVRAHEPNSHKAKGWEKFTDAVIKAVSDREEPVVFVLWGNYAKKKLPLIDTSRHVVVQGAHPSPLSAKLFFGSRPFSQINQALEGFGVDPIDWRVPDVKAG